MNHDQFFTFMRDLKKEIVPHVTPFKKVRIGNEADGGYVIADIPCKVCYSYGSNDEISFENGLFDRYGTKSYTYDHTIDKITNKPDHIVFKKEGVYAFKTSDCNSIESHLIENEEECSGDRHILLKMDVEECEWSVLYNCPDEILKKFSQIVVEFHFFGLHENMIGVFKKLNKHFKIIHLHANPHQVCPFIDSEFPRVLEITFLRNDLFDGNFVVDMESKFPDPDLDPRYAIPFPNMQWWKRPYDTKGIQLLREVSTHNI
jgi:hypothetical protein